MAPIILGLTYSAYVFSLRNENSWFIGLVVQVIAWSSQIAGHHVFEKRAPAFLDNLFQGKFIFVMHDSVPSRSLVCVHGGPLCAWISAGVEETSARKGQIGHSGVEAR